MAAAITSRIEQEIAANRAFRRQEHARDQKKITRIVAQVDELEVATIAVGATAAGDERRLRGIPAVGRGCAGHIRRTRPDSALLARERHRGS
jgi:hypothetical protein